MPGRQPSDVYREQLSSLSHGHALWDPDPMKKIYNQVSIGDVGYITNTGSFCRMFNVTLPWDHPSNNKLGQAEPFEPLDRGEFVNILEKPFVTGDYCTPNVSSEKDIDNLLARDPHDAEGITYKCSGPGALLSIPHDGHSEDIIRNKVFEDYIRNNVASWFDWSQKNGLDVERMEDLVLVTGCTLVTSWAAAAFLDSSEFSLIERPHQKGTSFEFNNIRGTVAQHSSRFDTRNPSPTEDQCVFVRGFRAKRRLFWTKHIRAAAESLPDDPDNRREDEVKVTRARNALKDRDPLIGVLDYIMQNCPEGTIAIAHDDDLQLIENVGIITANAVEQFLRKNHVPVLIEDGAAILRGDAPPVPQEKKFAAEEFRGEPAPLIVYPVLAKLLLELDFGESVDPDYDLPKEGFTTPAGHPPVLSLKLGNRQGYPAFIRIQASSNAPNIGITVQDVLRMIHKDLRKPSPRPAWDKLNDDERVAT